jgi:hypothetical protein
LPDWRDLASFNAEILEIADMLLEMEGQLRSLDEILNLDIDYVRAVFAYRKGQRFYDDFPKRPKAMRE